MTELNRVPNPASGAEPEAPESRIDWPDSPAGAAAQDPDVGALLERLGALPDLRVADHGGVYEGLHDDLLEALNADPSELTDAELTDAVQRDPIQRDAGGSAE
jgi:hypothetical protein